MLILKEIFQPNIKFLCFWQIALFYYYLVNSSATNSRENAPLN